MHIMAESDYFKSLLNKDKEAYRNKLTLSSGKLLPDPFSIKEWDNNVSNLPDFALGDLYSYLL